MQYPDGTVIDGPPGKPSLVMQGGAWVPVGGVGADKANPQEQKQMVDARDTADQAQHRIDLNSAYRSLNSRNDTGGPWRSAPLIGGMARDVEAAFNPEQAQMQAISNEIAPRMRVQGSGATSDYEQKLYLGASPGREKPEDANRGITYRSDVESYRVKARSAWLDQWAQRRGSLAGAESAFDKWWGQRMAGPAPAARGPSTSAPRELQYDPATGTLK